MPYVRSSRGSRSQFLPTKVANTISKAYAHVYGTQAAVMRPRVLEHTDAVVQHLRSTLGADPSSEWPRKAIREAIERELRQNANVDVQEAFFDQNPTTGKVRDERRAAERGWTGFPALPASDEEPDEINPTWNVTVWRAMDTAQASAGTLGAMGRSMARAPRRPTKTTGLRKVQVSQRRSNWFAWWRELSKQVGHPLDLVLFERTARRQADGPMALDSDGWWTFWQDILFQAMKADPRIFGLLRVGQQRVDRARLVGQDWLDGSGLNDVPQEEPRQMVLADTTQRRQAAVYRSIWVENARRLASTPGIHPAWASTYDLKALARIMQPERDALVDWRGHQRLLNGGCLWSLPEGHVWTVTGGIQVGVDAHEPPQWAWMRLAMSLALHEPRPREAVAGFYESISTLALLPSETMLRQAGRAQPNFLEDAAARVEDKFEAIYGAVHQAAVGTKWTGTVSLDWRAVRAAGSPIGGGQRRSNGIMPFLRTIHDALDAQGRVGADRPVTVALPIWHREADGFIEARHAVTPRLQTVLLVSDLFMRRVQESGSWTFFDPAFFPEVLDGTEAGYLAAETALAERKRQHPRSCRTMRAERVWRKLLRAMGRGAPFVTFEDADRPFAPFPESAPGVHGVDGVGALPLVPAGKGEDMAWVAWPSMAVNLRQCLGPDGKPDLDRLRTMVETALRMLDNAITAASGQHTPTVLAHRSVCLGAVGFYDAVTAASATSADDPALVRRWMAGLAEAWAASVMAADQTLRRERGAAPAWVDRAPDGDVFDPLGGVERLRAQRLGSLGMTPETSSDWASTRERVRAMGHRASARTVWAPFASLAAIAGVSPGGVGTLRPVERVIDEHGKARWVPTPLLLRSVLKDPDRMAELARTLKYPTKPKRWPESMIQWANPDAQGWRTFLEHASLIRPWVDQGVSLTLPEGLPLDRLSTLLQQAWWMGLSNVRLEALVPEPLDPFGLEDDDDAGDESSPEGGENPAGPDGSRAG